MGFFRFRRLAPLAFVALCWGQGPSQAGDLEDCLGPAGEKTEAACTAVINDTERTAEDHAKAHAARARFFSTRGKFDAGIADAEAAVGLTPQSTNALTARAYANQRAGKADAALAD
jgi:hypothetical protein